MARVILINSPTMGNEHIGTDNYFPLGLLYLATQVQRNDIGVRIIDVHNHFYPKLNVTEQELHKYIETYLNKEIKQYRPDIIGIGAIFSGAFKGLKIIAEEIKRKFPDIPIVIGGIHATMFAEEILEKYGYIDCVIIGEGEQTFSTLVYLITHKQPPAVDGIAFRYDGRVVVNPKTWFISNLNILPFVDYSLINIDDYEMDTTHWYSPKGIKIGRPFPLLSSRSCSQRCNFCNMKLVHGPKIRMRSPANVLDEMEHLYRDYGVRYFQFVDDNLTFDKERILAICRGIKERGLDIQFDTPNGISVNRLDKEVIDALVGAGMVKISLAIESGSEYIRNKVIGKGLSTKKIYDVTNECAKHKDLWIKGFFIIGMPQETHETLEETYKMMKELPINTFGIFFATPYPGTELFRYCEEYDLLPYKVEEYVDVEDLQLWATRPHFKPHELTEGDLMEFVERCKEE